MRVYYAAGSYRRNASPKRKLSTQLPRGILVPLLHKLALCSRPFQRLVFVLRFRCRLQGSVEPAVQSLLLQHSRHCSNYSWGQTSTDWSLMPKWSQIQQVYDYIWIHLTAFRLQYPIIAKTQNIKPIVHCNYWNETDRPISINHAGYCMCFSPCVIFMIVNVCFVVCHCC